MLAPLLDDANALGSADYRVESCVVLGDTSWYRDYRPRRITVTEHYRLRRITMADPARLCRVLSISRVSRLTLSCGWDCPTYHCNRTLPPPPYHHGESCTALPSSLYLSCLSAKIIVWTGLSHHTILCHDQPPSSVCLPA